MNFDKIINETTKLTHIIHFKTIYKLSISISTS